MSARSEPWLRGPLAGVDALVTPLLYTFQQAREDLARYTGPLTAAQLWSRPYGFGSVAFHLLHIAGSTDRLMTYLEGRDLTPEQMAALQAEEDGGTADSAELLARLASVFEKWETVIRAIDPATFPEARWVGRKRLPTTVIGLLTHIAEHTQRH